MSLTPREREIAALIALGYTYAEIGTQLEISPRTVDTHVSSAAKKLGDDGKTARIRVRDWWHRQKARIAGDSDGLRDSFRGMSRSNNGAEGA